jgi:hypothetical protein
VNCLGLSADSGSSSGSTHASWEGEVIGGVAGAIGVDGLAAETIGDERWSRRGSLRLTATRFHWSPSSGDAVEASESTAGELEDDEDPRCDPVMLHQFLFAVPHGSENRISM